MLNASRALTLVLALLLTGCQSLSFLVANLPSFGAARRTDLRYADGPRGAMDAYLVRPGEAPRPLVVFWYGGGFTEGQRAEYRFVGAALARAGYVTVLPDYRVYPEVRFPVFLEDAARAVVAAQGQATALGADPRRIVLAGHSAGAYIAAMLALNPEYLLRAGGDPRWIVGLVGLSGPYDIDPNTPVLDRVFRDTATPAEFKPVSFVTAAAPPTLLLHGEADTLVGASHARTLAAALAKDGVPVTLKLYADRGHADTVAALSWVARYRAPVSADLFSFLASLGDAPPRVASQSHQ